MSWYVLPTEVQWRIFQYLDISKHRKYQSPESHRAERRKATQSEQGIQSQYAAVNRQWQNVFERYNFCHLILGHSDIHDFGDIISRFHRRRLVRWIWLRVELPEYGCNKCTKPESSKEKKSHENRFTVALWQLLDYLSRLDNEHYGCRHSRVKLELSAHSPSDSEHHCQQLRNTMDDTMWHASREYTIRKPNDRTHGWRNGQYRGLQPGAYKRLFGAPRGLSIDLAHVSSWEKQPTPRAVTELFIRLQFFRHFSIESGLSLITQRLPMLNRLTYECRQGIDNRHQVCRQEEHRLLFNNILLHCGTLKRVVFYEKSNSTYRCIPLANAPRPIPADPVAGQALASHSGHLHELYVSWMVDAKDFFYDFWPGTIEQGSGWPHLKYLFLTTTLLPTRSRESLLQAAAAAAEQMPKLDTMELRGHTEKDKFRYKVQDRLHVVFIPEESRKLSKATIRCWQRVADLRGSPYKLGVRVMLEGDKERAESGFYPLSSYSATRTTIMQMRTEYKWRRAANDGQL